MKSSLFRKIRKWKRDPEAFWADSQTLMGKNIYYKFYYKDDISESESLEPEVKKHIESVMTMPTTTSSVETVMNKPKPKPKPKSSTTSPWKAEAYINESLKQSYPSLGKVLDEAFSYAKCKINWGSYRLGLFEIVIYDGNEAWDGYINESAVGILDLIWVPQKGSPLIEINGSFSGKIKDIAHYVNVHYYKAISDFSSLYYHYSDDVRGDPDSVTIYALRAGIYSEKVIAHALKMISPESKNMNDGNLNLVFSKLYRILGADWRLEEGVKHIRRSYKKLPDSFKMKIAAFYNEAGENEIALKILTEVKESNPSVLSANRYLGLSYLMWKEKFCREAWVEIDSRYYEILTSSMYEFTKYVKENDLAIVGNAPCEVGRAGGEDIDSGRKVLRFNSADVAYPHNVDYGQNMSVLVINPRYFETRRNMNRDLDFLIISDGDVYSTKNLSLRLHDLYSCCPNILCFPKNIDVELTQKIGASPSSGLKTLSWLYSIDGIVSKSDVYGFSLVDQSYGVATSYSRGTRGGLTAIHNWQSEKEYFDEVVK